MRRTEKLPGLAQAGIAVCRTCGEVIPPGFEKLGSTPGPVVFGCVQLDYVCPACNRAPVRRPVVLVATNPASPGLTKSRPTDAGWDLPFFTDGATSMRIGPGERGNLPSGVWINIPPGFACRIVSRSSTFLKQGLVVYEGLIDAGYQGELMTIVENPGDQTRVINRGDRLSQVVFFPVVEPVLRDVASPGDFPKTDRGTDGFGSSGR